MHIIYIYITCVYAWIFIGYKFVSRADFGVISVHSLFSFQNKDDHSKKKTMTTSFHASVGMWSPPYKTAREFLGISGKIYTLKNAKESFWSAPWGAKYKKKWQKGDMSFTRNPQEIRADLIFFYTDIFFVSLRSRKNKAYDLYITY